MKRFLKILAIIILSILLLGVSVYFGVQNNRVQTWLSHRAAAYLSNELGAKVTVGSVGIDLWARIVLNDLYIEDQKQDTLVFIPKLHVGAHHLDRKTKTIKISRIEIDNPVIFLARHEGDSTFNYQFIIDYFSSGSSAKDTTDTSFFQVEVGKMQINNGTFRYSNFRKPERTRYGIDWNRMFAKNCNIDIRNIVSRGGHIQASIKEINAIEKSGFQLKEMNGTLDAVSGNVQLTNAHIITNQSEINGNIAFEFESIDDFDDFENKVVMKNEFNGTKLCFADLAYFTPEFKGLNKTIEITGKINGKVSKLKGKNLYVKWDTNSWFKGNVDLDGLPDIEQTFIELDIDELTSNKTEIELIQLPPFDTIPMKFVATPANISALGQLKFKGNFTGFINDFVAYGNFKTAIGGIGCDIALKKPQEDYEYKGNIRTTAFDLGRFYNQKDLGTLSCNFDVEGSGLTLKSMDSDISGVISDLAYRQYTYKNIKATGTFKKSFFDGDFSVQDDNVVADFSGQIDLANSKPSFNFSADIGHLNLKELNLLRNTDYASVSGEVKVVSQGLSFSNFAGTVTLDNFAYCANDKDYELAHLEISSQFVNEKRTIEIQSPIANGKLEGLFDFNVMEQSFGAVIGKIIPSYQPKEAQHRQQQFTLNIDLLDFSQVSEIFFPGIAVAPDTRVYVLMDEPNSNFELSVQSDSVYIYETMIEGLSVDARRPDNSLYFTVATEQLHMSGFDLNSLTLDGRTEKDTVFTSLVWDDPNKIHSGDINGKFLIRGNKNFDFTFDRSSVVINNQKWNFNKNASVKVDSTTIATTNLEVRYGQQFIKLDGMVATTTRDRLEIVLSAFDLANLNFLTEKGGIKLNGIVSGTGSLRDFYKDRILVSDLTLIDFVINSSPIGDLCIESNWDNNLRWLKLEGELERNKRKTLTFNGTYQPDVIESPLNIMAHADDLDLSFINAFMAEGVVALDGNATGEIAITGTLEEPQLKGLVQPDDFSIYVYYLHTKYFVDGPVGIEPDMFTFDYIECRDEEGNRAHLTGAIAHQNWAKWNFDVTVDTDIQSEDKNGRMRNEALLCLNTSDEEGAMYYGKAYATGYVNIFGYAENLEFDINLRSEKGTVLNMPLGSTSEVTFEEFLHFVDKDNPVVEEEEEVDLSGIKLNFELDITPDVDFNIILDEAVGDVMSGHGKGHLNMDINQFGDFSMFGVIEVTDGEYLFTLKNLVNKEFTIRPGGTIAWYGDPYAADINLQSAYKLSAALYDLFPEDNPAYKQRVPVDLVMDLTGKLLTPDIGFEIELPSTDDITRNRVASVISTEQEKNRQAFALLVLRKFVSPPNVTKTSGSIGLAENSSELLSSQLSNWLSQISDDFNLGFNYRPGDEISNEEIALALSTQLFNDRLLISGNFGVSRGSSANQNASSLIGDIRVEYKLTPEGKLRLLVYNHSNDFDIATTELSPYTQGVGIIYQEEFDTIDQFFCGFKNLFRRRKEQLDCL